MTIYFGVDFHPRQQTTCYCDSADGEVRRQESHHERDDVRGFYDRFTGEVTVELEASGYSTWFKQMLEGLWHEIQLGDVAEVRSV